MDSLAILPKWLQVMKIRVKKDIMISIKSCLIAGMSILRNLLSLQLRIYENSD